MMEFVADVKGVRLSPSKTTVTLEVAPDQTGSLDGLQLLMSQTVRVEITGIQTRFEFAEGA